MAENLYHLRSNKIIRNWPELTIYSRDCKNKHFSDNKPKQINIIHAE